MRYGRRVVVTGLGAVTPLGVGAKRTWDNLLTGHIGITSLIERFADQKDKYEALPSRIAGLVPRGRKVSGGWDPSEWLDKSEQHRMAEFAQYAIAATEEALLDSGCLPLSSSQKERTGVSIGSGIGSLQDLYNTAIAYASSGYRSVSPLFVPRLLINLAAGHISIRHGLLGPNMAATTACTTGAHSIGDAARLVAHGDADTMIAGASEACIHPLALAGFARARSLATNWNDDPQRASRPFDSQRAGFVIGEGAGVLILESLEHAQARGAERIYAEVLGYGQSADGNHITAPLVSGHGAALAMQKSLSDAGVRPSEVDYVNAHATSTRLGDAAENKAIQDVLLGRGQFGIERWQDSSSTTTAIRTHNTKFFKQTANSINISSTKGHMGHLLGAAGAVEAILTIKALQSGILPPTANLETIDRDEKDDDGQEVWGANYISGKPQQQDISIALSNSFGFGGTNASLCFGRWPGDGSGGRGSVASSPAMNVTNYPTEETQYSRDGTELEKKYLSDDKQKRLDKIRRALPGKRR